MKTQRMWHILLSAVLISITSCQQRPEKIPNLAPNAHQVTAEEVIQTSRYTYVRVLSDGRDYWIAINKADVKEGGTYFWSEGMEMNNFTSKEMNRTFPSIFFVQDFTDQPILHSRPVQPQGTMAGQPQTAETQGISVEKVKGGYTIAELFAQKEALKGKTVSVRGQVVKFSPQIMKRNWVHLQDGTRDGDHFDLAVTTNDTVAVGEVVVIEGRVSVNKDFGAGYVYDLILEEGKIKK